MDTPLNSLSLCSGGGGLDLGLELVLPRMRTVCWVEWEAFACDYLATRMEEGCLHPAPIWTDLRTFDGRAWRGVVDCLTAGYPCQPFSTAGKRGGTDDPRHLWPHVRRIIGEVEPGFLLLENVSGHASLGGEQVVTDLQGLGYETACGLFTAAEVGASHKRERLFILGVLDDTREQESGRLSSGEWHSLPQIRGRSQGVADACCNRRRFQVSTAGNSDGTMRTAIASPSNTVADATSPRCSGRENSRASDCHEATDESRRAEPERGCTCLAGVGQSRLSGTQLRREPDEAKCGQQAWSATAEFCGTQLFPPGPDAADKWQNIPQFLWPATQPGLCELVDGLAPDRTRYLKLLGNGVVPLQAAYAFVSLWAVLAGRRGTTELNQKPNTVDSQTPYSLAM